MRKLLFPLIVAAAICFASVFTGGAQPDTQSGTARRAEASRARSDSMALVREQEQAMWDAKKARYMRTVWLVFIIGASIGAVYWFHSKRSTVLGVIRIFTGGFRTKGDVTTLESKKILVGAIYSEQQGAYLNTLTTGIETEKRHTFLTEGWNITDPFNAVDTLDYLRDKGYGYYFPTVLKAASARSDDERKEIILSEMTTQEDAERAYSQTLNLIDSIATLINEKVIETADDIERYGVRGWDAGRLVFIARMCYDAKYIDEGKAWQYIDAAYALARSSFDSWNELAKSYIIGRYLWGGKDIDGGGMAAIVEHLLEKPDSPWNKVALR